MRACTSSPMSVTLGCVWRAHSSVMLLAARPISRTKNQYLPLAVASMQTLPMSSEYTLQAVSNPKEMSI